MKVAVMQPYAFPYIGYFQLINYADKWVVFDDTQYINKGWINRNRILHPNFEKEWQYFTVPLCKHPRNAKILDLKINDNIKWRDELLGKLSAYKRKAPYYTATLEFVRNCISFKSLLLSDWILHTLKCTCSYLNIEFDYKKYSQMRISAENVKHAGQWALEVAAAMGADEYVNPAGGYAIFNEEEFVKKNINLRFLNTILTPYVQRRGYFVPGLSIIDVMMWNDVKKIKKMLSDCVIVTQKMLMN